MIYSFKSRATGTLHMNTTTAELLLQAIGHEVSPQGVITVDQMPAAIEALRRLETGSGSEKTRVDSALTEHIDPAIAMLEQALSAGKNVTWGV